MNFCLILAALGEGLHFTIHDIIKEFAMLRVLHDNEDVGGGLDDFIHLCDGGMPGYFEDMELAGYPFHICYILYLILLQNLDGDGLIGRSMNC